MFCFCSVPATGLCEVSLADRILSFSELDPSITPSILHDVRDWNFQKEIKKTFLSHYILGCIWNPSAINFYLIIKINLYFKN